MVLKSQVYNICTYQFLAKVIRIYWINATGGMTCYLNFFTITGAILYKITSIN